MIRLSCIFFLVLLSFYLKAQQMPDRTDREGVMLVRKKKTTYIQMPELRGLSFKTAQMELKMRGLKLGKVNWGPDTFSNPVIRQFANGEEIKAGTMIDRNAIISLEVGVGKGKSKDDIGY